MKAWPLLPVLPAMILLSALLAGCGRSGPPAPALSEPAPIVAELDEGRLQFERWDELAIWLDTHNGGPVFIRIGPGEFAATRSLRLPSHSRLQGAGDGTTRIIARRDLDALIANRQIEQGDVFITVEHMTLDCSGRARNGVFQRRVTGLRLSALTVTGCMQTGIRVSGHGQITRGAVLHGLTATENPGDGIMILWATRNARYSDLFAHRNGGTGIVIDHSEGTGTNLIANENRRNGIFLRNMFSVTAANMSATRNGQHGILAQGFVASAGTGWTALGNSVNTPGEFDEIHFSAAGDLSYGVTDRSVIQGIVAGAYEHGTGQPTARHGLYIAPEISGLVRSGVVFLDVLEDPVSAPGLPDHP